MTPPTIGSDNASGSGGTAAQRKQGLIDRGCLKSSAVKAVCVMASLSAVGLFGLAESKASTTVKINSHYYTCQNSCVVSTRPGGGFSVWDSRGGWVTKTAEKGEALVETGPVT
ncbi:hypothetical protein LRM36_05910 [Stenotrophomonas maltophilia]|uniref:hypothetical protein n=1 Tax=Stenotrophomonas pavanii TaxID=487698 RepID=UPI00128EEC0F|nr:hypothetical protein [Stenotrophomonas pavanii]MBH1625385.1 hypothetical protein [Stenotrophomonas maltophilia]MBN5150692.1 hypothetical protein [Stenotrophomonas maltophilia]MCU1047818.1 hypothetical protein [Stenotrophomonas maltophilia]MDA5337949.1 hypothetical protein [Stenotrophomonas maltophilia]MEC4340262.1 hypothetical protein [Stenotrophomonas pavanii]